MGGRGASRWTNRISVTTRICHSARQPLPLRSILSGWPTRQPVQLGLRSGCASQRLRPRMRACCRAAAVTLPGPASNVSDQRPRTVLAGSLLRRWSALPNRSSMRRCLPPARLKPNICPDIFLVPGLFRAVRQQRLQVAALVQAHQDVAAAHKLALDVQLRGHNCRGVKTPATTRKPQCAGYKHTLRVHVLLHVKLPGICLWNAATCTRQSCRYQRTGNFRASAPPSTHGFNIFERTCGIVGQLLYFFMASRRSGSARTLRLLYSTPAQQYGQHGR